MKKTLPLLKELVTKFHLYIHLEKEIKLIIDDHGDVVDDASPTLKSIRQSIRTYEAKVREHYKNYTYEK